MNSSSSTQHTKFLIVGGGISGLATAWQLNNAGLSSIVLEARERIGGRVLTTDQQPVTGQPNPSFCDLGPSWFWTGQPLVRQLLEKFDIPFFQQHAAGDTLYQQPDGSVASMGQSSPMAGALRIDKGVGRLANALADQLAPNQLRLQHVVGAISQAKEAPGESTPHLRITCDTPSGSETFSAQHVVLALPPRLAAAIEFTPGLPASTLERLNGTPTWMAGHAKFFAVYPRPFWRESGLCGSAISRKGPLAEIHDASPNSAQCFSLFGFAGIAAEDRARIGAAQFTELAVKQLVEIFGDDAKSPTDVQFHDWSADKFTSTDADQVPQTRHPEYGLRPEVGPHWKDRIHFISSETSFVNGGLIEGALEGAHRLISQFTAPPTQTNDESVSHTASMGWDWL